MKDGLIVIQGLLLAACIAAVLLRKQKLVSRSMNKPLPDYPDAYFSVN